MRIAGGVYGRLMPATRSQLTIAEAAKILEMNKRTLWRHVRSGKVPATKLPAATGAYLIDRRIIEKMINERTRAALSQAS